MYTHTVRREMDEGGEIVETRTSITRQIYDQLLSQVDRSCNVTIEKTRRCFVYNDQIYQLDIFQAPHPGLMLLETYSPLPPEELILPPFLDIAENVSGNPKYSMYNLSKAKYKDTRMKIRVHKKNT
ncbi:TRPL translocation defect protein 14 isoform X2 [Eurytemora carolleeae]|uniref:TRPL translocation defect protein 14 isoform X2 n=1 Tax=Eurytemora carolleeae TaxID=1294199 RepID=UPI000C78155D|nr:TRPL translocation defect protein 14 isoform X2 [Eurytemora carolleeae]|eukprot:XP_023331948.1 TRPL translocation defect protein 14-like isoform X2 [Eurytemora affinis]